MLLRSPSGGNKSAIHSCPWQSHLPAARCGMFSIPILTRALLRAILMLSRGPVKRCIPFLFSKCCALLHSCSSQSGHRGHLQQCAARQSRCCFQALSVAVHWDEPDAGYCCCTVLYLESYDGQSPSTAISDGSRPVRHVKCAGKSCYMQHNVIICTPQSGRERGVHVW